eukprot:CAMPEP_0116999372 /NCGR_PEP_ID=MMETSP0472-20121206/2100_1 /TAXON_ID=693140 ORGANISM="Tiarina fusus, Strain LIS" /NCGR_SAMPLE_ID=MMETSP0472 /ASSEMBLY_ACC=CAM_ASM_000603 /LENGTH=309 /DNA_ID=CAMNT_0004698771 /DNA_START=13 /DNA_END=942 /DNA_ORIENTATION=+
MAGYTTLTFADIIAQQPHSKGYAAAPVFVQGEKIFAFHQSMLYEAKILKVEMRNKMNSTRKEMYYFIHYQGWKTKWDEWVNDSRILKYTDQNRDFQRQMRELKEGSNKKRSLRKLRELTPPPEPKKPCVEEIPEEILDAPETLELPFILQRVLAEDYDNIQNNKQVVTMPVQFTVFDILQSFADEKLQKNSETNPFNFAIISDIRAYFDQALGTLLLYRIERTQYQRILANMKAKKCPEAFSQIYGPQHLLRLFYLLPEIVEEAGMPRESKNLILYYVSEILEYMERNSPELFSHKAYSNVPEDYFKDM